jgi:cob(I)alamin adenosyltransferase
MPRLTRLYTRKGDDGTTGLGGGQRVPKDSPRVGAYGAVDELNSAIGIALSHGLVPRLAEILPVVQNELFHLGSDLCFLEEDKQKVLADRSSTGRPSDHAAPTDVGASKFKLPQIEARHVTALERIIDELNEAVGPLENFILPGGAIGSAHLQLARTICRRAECDVIALSRLEPIGKFVVAYLNRLSDALFVMGRYENKMRGVAEPLWNTKL